MPVCSNCGIIQESGTHCGQCGEPLVGAQPETAPGVATGQPAGQPEFVGTNRGTIDQRTDRSHHEDHSSHVAHHHHESRSMLPMLLGALGIFGLTVVIIVFVMTGGLIGGTGSSGPTPVPADITASIETGAEPAAPVQEIDTDNLASTPLPPEPTALPGVDTEPVEPVIEPVRNPDPDPAQPSQPAWPPNPGKVALQVFVSGDDASAYVPLIVNTFAQALADQHWTVIDGDSEPYDPGYVMTIEARFEKQLKDFQGLEKEMLEMTMDVSTRDMLHEETTIPGMAIPSWSHATRLPSLLRDNLAQHLQETAKSIADNLPDRS